MDRDKMSNLYRGPSIDASYQVSVHLAKGVSEKKIKMWKVNGRRTPSDGKSSHCLWQGELKNNYLQNTLQKTKDWATGTPLKTVGELRSQDVFGVWVLTKITKWTSLFYKLYFL